MKANLEVTEIGKNWNDEPIQAIDIDEGEPVIYENVFWIIRKLRADSSIELTRIPFLHGARNKLDIIVGKNQIRLMRDRITY